MVWRTRGFIGPYLAVSIGLCRDFTVAVLEHIATKPSSGWRLISHPLECCWLCSVAGERQSPRPELAFRSKRGELGKRSPFLSPENRSSGGSSSPLPVMSALPCSASRSHSCLLLLGDVSEGLTPPTIPSLCPSFIHWLILWENGFFFSLFLRQGLIKPRLASNSSWS